MGEAHGFLSMKDSLPITLTVFFSNLKFQVLIECGSASSFELSPRFANHPMRERLLSSQEQFHQDVENEISDAMSDTIIGEENLDGEPISFF